MYDRIHVFNLFKLACIYTAGIRYWLINCCSFFVFVVLFQQQAIYRATIVSV